MAMAVCMKPLFLCVCMDMADMGSELVLCVCKLAKQIFGANPARNHVTASVLMTSLNTQTHSHLLCTVTTDILQDKQSSRMEIPIMVEA